MPVVMKYLERQELKARIGIAALCLHEDAVAWCDDVPPNTAHVPERMLRVWAPSVETARLEELVGKLMAEGLWTETDDGYEVNLDAHGGLALLERWEKERRTRQARAAANARWNGDGQLDLEEVIDADSMLQDATGGGLQGGGRRSRKRKREKQPTPQKLPPSADRGRIDRLRSLKPEAVPS